MSRESKIIILSSGALTGQLLPVRLDWRFSAKLLRCRPFATFGVDSIGVERPGARDATAGVRRNWDRDYPARAASGEDPLNRSSADLVDLADFPNVVVGRTGQSRPGGYRNCPPDDCRGPRLSRRRCGISPDPGSDCSADRITGGASLECRYLANEPGEDWGGTDRCAGRRWGGKSDRAVLVEPWRRRCGISGARKGAAAWRTVAGGANQRNADSCGVLARLGG